MKYEKIFLACDHAGLPLKKSLLESNPKLPWKDLGTTDEKSVDYPDYADKLAQEMAKHKDGTVLGVLICGSGQGMAIRANRYPHIRAALCWSPEIAELSRQHNKANVLCMGSRLIPAPLAQEIFQKFLNTEFEGGRHEGRVTKLSAEC